MKRKKVAILLPWLKMGGTNKIAVNFMAELSEFCEVTLILSQNCGELLPELPEHIHVIVDEMKIFQDIMQQDIKHLRLQKILQDIIYYVKIKTGYDSIDNYKYIVERNKCISKEMFDCAINYHGQSPERMLNLIYRIKSKKKIAWIHGEMGFSQDKLNRLKKYYDKMDYFYFVSAATLKSFDRTIGVDYSKAMVYYNPINKKDILKRAEETMEIDFDTSVCNILTVGRISAEKGQDMIPVVARILLDKGYKFCWYIIGDGDNSMKIRQLIEKYEVEEHVKLLGVKMNPYCYMKNCDLYVQPSYTEGYSTTICEAGILGKAVIGTKTSGGVREQITDGENGMIVDATVEGLADGIAHLIDCPEEKKKFEREIAKKNFEGTGEIKKFLSYLEMN